MKTLIIYCSKTGFTRKYAQWLREDLDCDCVPFSERHSADLARYGAVAFGSGCYVGRIHRLGWFKRQMPGLEGKKLAVFFTGAMSPDPSDVRRLERENFNPRELCRVKTFYLQGGLNYGGMNPVDKALMAVFRQALRSKSDSPRCRVMLQNIGQSFDKTERENLRPLEEYLKS
ncbi:flavodoxin domain-containing protein [Acutalibacter sp.]|uniref:flavodoxin domain-containing protein n=1 Tax=Acutalibacter sp. TaxID=1918636 RepID=UPI00216B8DBD|nr:hypothetical protein [Acutalibacter sp.]